MVLIYAGIEFMDASVKNEKKPGYTIVVVDDDAGIRQVITAMLALEPGIRTFCAENGKEGLALIKKHRPHLAILDIVMPGMDGLAVLKTLKENPATLRIPVLMLTGHDSKENLRSSMEWYAYAYLSKPFTRDELILKVRRLLPASGTAQSGDAGKPATP
jgi:CheY-like chemotaxis protein